MCSCLEKVGKNVFVNNIMVSVCLSLRMCVCLFVRVCVCVCVSVGLVGPAPTCVRWVCLVMDLHYLVSVYLNRRYSHLKALKLCANMSVKNTMTSDLLLDPG